MKNQRFISINLLDFLGFSTSILCALHCAAVPLLFTLGSFSSLAFLQDPMVEGIVLIAGFCLAFLSLLPAYFKKHHNPHPLLIMLAGSSIIIGSHLSSSFFAESVLVPVGACAIAAAHFKNWNLNKKIAKDHHPSQMPHSTSPPQQLTERTI